MRADSSYVRRLTRAKNPATFADDDMIAANNTWTVQIPASIKAGNYVLRHETIALHQAQGAGGAQPYPYVSVVLTFACTQ